MRNQKIGIVTDACAEVLNASAALLLFAASLALVAPPACAQSGAASRAGVAQSAAGPTPDIVERPPMASAMPLFFREDWISKGRQHPVTQADTMNQNLELKLYGPSGKDIVTVSEVSPAQTGGAPPHVFTGLCERTCAAALRDKNNFVDVSGFGKIRWTVKESGLHRVHPIIKLANGTWLLGEHEDSNLFDFHPSEFTFAESRWIRLDIEKVVTRGNWLDKSELDLTKVDEVGFTDLMPGSGHGDGGYTDVGWIEVYGKPVPRTSR